MQKSKMIEILRNFSAKELSRFGEYLASPFFNKNDTLTGFFKYICKYAPAFTDERLQKEPIFKDNIPGIGNDEKKLAYAMSYILEQAENFIKVTSCQHDKMLGFSKLLAKYNAWGSEKFFEQTLNKAKQELEKYPYRNSDYFFQEYIIETETNAYFDSQKKRAYDASLQKAADHLDLFYLSTKLKYSCELMNRQKLVAANYELRLINEIMYHMQDKSYDQYPGIAIYHHIFMMFLENEKEEHFYKLKDLLDKNINRFDPQEARDMFAYAQNYCIRKANAGNNKYLTELLSLYKSAIEKKVIVQDNTISPWAYKNIVSVATRVGDVAWVEQFIEEYKNYLNPKFRANAYQYNIAYLNYSKTNYAEALKLLNQVEFTDVFYSLDSRTLQIKIYYEMDEVNALMSALDAFRVYLRRNKTISEDMQTVYMNFVKFTGKLLRINDNEKDKLASLAHEIETKKNVADINWLLQKASKK